MKISICNKCKGFNYKKIIDFLKKNYQIDKIEIGCNNTCGIGRDKAVVLVDDVLYSANNEEELIKKINTKLK